MVDPRSELGSESIRILEIGNWSHFKTALPEQTTLFNTAPRRRESTTPGAADFSLVNAPDVIRSVARNEYDLIVLYAPTYAPSGMRWVLRLLSQHPVLFPGRWIRGLGVAAARIPTQTPIVVLDMEDTTAIGRHNLALLSRCRAYFKRELPLDHWKVFTGTLHPSLPTMRLRNDPFLQRCIDKLKPISPGIPDASLDHVPVNRPEKTADVFFAGTISSTVRRTAVAQLQSLVEEGYVVDVPDSPLPRDEFLARCARAWLTLSPEGLGWECFRHYEASACLSVPIINRAGIHRYQPLLNGVHCFIYDVEGDGLASAIRAALSDKSRLVRMAEEARAHVLQHHTKRKICEHILRTCLGDRAIQLLPTDPLATLQPG